MKREYINTTHKYAHVLKLLQIKYHVLKFTK
jgi:hypothetical protein